MIANDLFEGPINPGEEYRINLKISDYKHAIQNIGLNKTKLEAFKNIDHSDTPELLPRINALIKAYEDELAVAESKIKELLKMKDPNSRLEKLLLGIQKNCTEILDVYKSANSVLYRGTKNVTSDAFFSKPYENRSPKDSNGVISYIFNDAMKRRGIAARRNNSIFTTGLYSHALRYGKVYVIFPVNGFNFSYSKTEKDVVFDMWSRPVFNSINHNVVNQIYKYLCNNKEAANKFFKISKYSMPEQNKFYHKKYLFDEGFFSVGGYANDVRSLQAMENDLPPELYKLVSFASVIDGDKLIDQYSIVSDNLVDGIKTGHEILINSKFYAISTAHSEVINKMLGINSRQP